MPAFALAALLLASCGTIDFNDDPSVPSGGGERRVYVNDKAANDSLRADVIEKGIKLVLQPGKPYELSITTARKGDKLHLFYFRNGSARTYKTLIPLDGGDQQVYSLASDQSTAQFFLAQLGVANGAQAIPEIRHVAFASVGTGRSDTLNVRLLFIRGFTTLGTAAEKDSYANSFFGEMAKHYTAYGVALKGSYEIVEPNAAPMEFPFDNTYVPLPGARVPGHAHIYLVDRIVVSSGDPNAPQGEVLGFASREVLDLDKHRESRVLLANRTSVARQAVTAVHELGHFFGLRHTVSTEHDIAQDRDASNLEDGFADTRGCDILGKRAAVHAEGPVETPYCLRVAGRGTCSSACDLTNLMHPVECAGVAQTQLSGEQRDFLKKNMSLYQQ